MVTVVITHYNRVHLLERALYSFKHNKSAEFNVIIVDDCSNDLEIKKLISLKKKYNQYFNIDIILIDKKDKWYDNPCIPFNIGIREARGDIVIIQSAECIHLGNVIDHANKNLTANNYFSYSCYSVDKEQTKSLLTDKDYSPHELLDLINPPNNAAVTHCEEKGWYNHPVYRPLGYHWCNAYNRDDLLKIKMFDERYSKGVAYDDDELSFRSKRDLKLNIIESPIVLHQWHGLENYYKQTNQVENQIKQDYNRSMFERVTQSDYNNDSVRNDLSLTVDYIKK